MMEVSLARTSSPSRLMSKDRRALLLYLLDPARYPRLSGHSILLTMIKTNTICKNFLRYRDLMKMLTQ
jgi:hypothetical protein